MGVRERLQSRFHRSLKPEEIDAEMRRDKRYGGRTKRKNEQDLVMHGNQLRSPLSVEVATVTKGCTGEYVDIEENDIAPTFGKIIGNTGSDGITPTVKVTSSGVPRIMDDQIASNPFIVELIDRLAALANSLKSKSAEIEALTTKSTTTALVKAANLASPAPHEPIARVEVRLKKSMTLNFLNDAGIIIGCMMYLFEAEGLHCSK